VLTGRAFRALRVSHAGLKFARRALLARRRVTAAFTCAEFASCTTDTEGLPAKYLKFTCGTAFAAACGGLVLISARLTEKAVGGITREIRSRAATLRVVTEAFRQIHGTKGSCCFAGGAQLTARGTRTRLIRASLALLAAGLASVITERAGTASSASARGDLA
jgi:hypothetical protein